MSFEQLVHIPILTFFAFSCQFVFLFIYLLASLHIFFFVFVCIALFCPFAPMDSLSFYTWYTWLLSILSTSSLKNDLFSDETVTTSLQRPGWPGADNHGTYSRESMLHHCTLYNWQLIRQWPLLCRDQVDREPINMVPIPECQGYTIVHCTTDNWLDSDHSCAETRLTRTRQPQIALPTGRDRP